MLKYDDVIERMAEVMQGSVGWSCFWSKEDAKQLCKAALLGLQVCMPEYCESERDQAADDYQQLKTLGRQ